MKLNIGCGKDIKKGWINLDSIKIDGVDVVHNIEMIPLPFEDGKFDVILCQDVLEHIDIIHVLEDIYRIMKKDAVLKIRVPHFSSVSNFTDPTHKTMFSINKFDFFLINSKREYYFNFHFSKIQNKKITFHKSMKYFYNFPVELIINISKSTRNFYESSGFCRIFPAQNISLELIK